MKTPSLLSLALMIGLGLVPPALAEKSPATLPAALKGVALAEIPDQAAALIFAAKPASRETTATEVVSGAVKTYPAIASAIVGAVCTKCPQVAAVVAKAAIKVQPQQAQLLANAAAAAAPNHKADIAKALAALGESVPTLKASLSPVIASLQSAAPQLANATATTAAANAEPPAAGSGRIRGPIVSGPYVPLSGTPTNSPPGTSVPPPGNDYARP